MMDVDLSKNDMTESDLSDVDKLLGIIECQLQIIVTISEMDSDLYDEWRVQANQRGTKKIIGGCEKDGEGVVYL